MAFTKVVGAGIHTLSNIASHNINSSGIITATKFVGPIEGNITAVDGVFTGNVSIAKTLTYEDVKNVDSVGVGTFREGIFIPDNKRIRFGNTNASPNFSIYSTPTYKQGLIDYTHSGTGRALRIRATNLQIENWNGLTPTAKFIGGVGAGHVELNYAGSKKFETTSSGVSIGGTTIITPASGGKVGIGTDNPVAKLQLEHSGLNAELFRTWTTLTSGVRREYFLKGPSAGNSNNPYRWCTGNSHSWEVDNIERMRIDHEGRILMGGTSSRDIGFPHKLQLEDNDTNPKGLSIISNRNTIHASHIDFAKTRGTSLGSNTIVQNGDYLGHINFRGADGTDLGTSASRISASVDGTPGSNNVPGNLTFWTQTAGGSIAERLRIDNVGWLGLGQTSKDNVGQVAAFKNTSNANSWLSVNVNNNTGTAGIVFGDSDAWAPAYIQFNHTHNRMEFHNGGEKLRITSDGWIGAGQASSDNAGQVAAFTNTSDNNSWLSVNVNNNTGTGGVVFGRSNAWAPAYIQYNHTGNYMQFFSNSAEAIRITSSGEVNIGGNYTQTTAPLCVTTDANSFGIRVMTGSNKVVDILNNDTAGSCEIRGYYNNNSGTQGEGFRIESNGETFFSPGGTQGLNITSAGNVVVSQTLYITDTIQHHGDNDTKIRFPSDNTFTVETNGNEAFRIDSGRRLLHGVTSNTPVASSAGAQLQVHNNASVITASFTGYGNHAGGSVISLGKSRSNTVGDATGAVSNGDTLGDIRFGGSDGTDMHNTAAAIRGEVDGSVSSNSIPGRLEFSTNSGSGSVERLRITSSGSIKLPDNAKIELGGAQTGSGDLHIYHDSSTNFNNIQSQTGSNLRIRQLGNGAGLYLAATHIYLQNHNNNQTYLHAQNNGSVILNHSGNARAYTAADGFALSRVNTFPNPNNTGSEITGAMLDIGGNLHLEERYPAGAYSDRQDLVFRFNTGYGQGFTDKIRFTSGGKIELQVDGGGIRFPNTQTPTSSMTSRVGISSEMRYYESGEFVPGLSSTVLNGLQIPAFTDASYTRRIGRYVRVGNLVFLNIEILMAGSVTYNAGSTSTAPVCITGIPFSFQYANRWASTGHPDYYPCAISYSSTGLTNDTLYASLQRNYNAQPRIEITKPGTNGSRQYNSTNFGEVFPANGHVIVSCTYAIDINNADY